jgi:Tfp pilus assembly protein PilN
MAFQFPQKRRFKKKVNCIDKTNRYVLMASLVQNILLGKHYIGLEFFSHNNEEKIAFVLLQKKKNEITISHNDIFAGRERLLDEKSKYPAVLVINNEQILQKETAGTDPNDKKLLHKAFPNLQDDDFYYEIWRRETSSVITICRRSYVDGLISSIEKNFSIVNISLGVTSLSNLTAFGLPETITTNTQVLTPYEDTLVNNTKMITPAEHDINGLEVTNTHILAFSGALQLLLPGTTTGNIVMWNGGLFENFRQRTFFEKGIRVSVILILALLLVNFFLFTYYFDNATAMAQTVSVNRSGIENIGKINTRINDKEKRLLHFTEGGRSASSSLLNEIAKLLPSSITLTEMTYGPLDKKVKEDVKILLTDKLVTVSGNTLSNAAFTAWIENIEKLGQVRNVVISSFGKDADNKTAFSVQIQLK